MAASERRQPPQWFQDALASIGGRNRFGGANFDVVWSQTATIELDGQPKLQCLGQPCWVLRQWKAPEFYGSQVRYFAENSDESGKSFLGDYPWRGRYEIVQPFRWSGIVNGKLVQEFMPLNSVILMLVVPVIRQCQDVSYLQRLAILQDEHERKELAQQKKIADRLQDASPTWQGPVSFSRQGCKTSLIEKKMYQIQQNMNNAMKVMRTLGRGGYSAHRRQVA
jgi:hypothetical protein